MKGQTLTRLVVMLICVTGTEAGAAAGPEAVAIDFTRDIQPLFAKHCLLCHGPDAAQGGLRLHTQAAAAALLESGSHGIVPGDPAASEVLARVTSRDPLLQMPPEGDRLTPAETDLLEAWIAQAPPGKPTGPTVLSRSLRLRPSTTSRRRQPTSTALWWQSSKRKGSRHHLRQTAPR